MTLTEVSMDYIVLRKDLSPTQESEYLQEIETALESLEMVYSFHPELINHNEIMWKQVRKISDAIANLKKTANKPL